MQSKKHVIGKAEVQRAADLLEAYRRGKQSLDRRILEDERWYRLRHGAAVRPGEPAPASGWLLNSLLGKHGDMMDNPAPDVLPREPSDMQDAKTLSRILPVILERSDFEGLYSHNAYPKLRHGTACYGVFWDPEAEDGRGDVRVTAVDLLNLFWEPGVRDIQDSRNLFLVTQCDNDLLDAAYPALRGKLRAPVDSTNQRIPEDVLDRSGKSQVVDWYYKKRLPNGKTIVHFCKFVGSTVLYASENEQMFMSQGLYDHGQYPFVLDVLFPLEDSPAGFGYVDLMKGTQGYIDHLKQCPSGRSAALVLSRCVRRQRAGICRLYP